ncbi:hypothetical protein VTN00DRAFT_573 [Thermoascus crustaceus]|uniref:uncharacterized protein n=1 Tax=Thermoascus crustaceus TaxID=5088 RepID=UPI0037431011
MNNRRDHYTSSHDFHDFHSYQTPHSGLLEDPFIQPTEAPLLPAGVALTDSVRNYDLYSAVDTWMTSGFFSQLPEPMPMQMLNNAISWGLGVAEDCVFNPSQVSKVLAPEGSNYPFSVDGDNCMDSPSSTDSFPDLSQSTYHLANSGEREMFSDSTCGAEIYAPSTPFLEDQSYCISFTPGSHRQQPERPVSGPDGTSIGPSSPAPSISSHQSLEPRHAVSPVTMKRRSTNEVDDVEACYGDTDEDGNNDPPYSLLIYQALTSAPGMKLPLQGIYSWFEKNTTKGKDQNSKGWQNSIRHNLSMNAGFEAVKEESPTGKKPVNFWRLTEEAIKNGVQSTTRYRKQGNHKKSVKSENPAPQRQRSGAKGGRAAKIAARFRRANHDEQKNERYRHRNGLLRRPYKDGPSPSRISAASVHASIPIASATGSPSESFDLGSVVGCTETPLGSPIFYQDAESEPADGLPLVFGYSMDGREPCSIPDGLF